MTTLLVFLLGLLAGGTVVWLGTQLVVDRLRRQLADAEAEARRERCRNRLFVRVNQVFWSSPTALVGPYTVEESET